MGWFTKKSRLENLKERYRALMRKSYELALRDTEKSERIHRQADKLFQEIQYLNFRQADN